MRGLHSSKNQNSLWLADEWAGEGGQCLGTDFYDGLTGGRKKDSEEG